ncbi:MAG: hypothetical protein ACREDY_06310, partial [Bradyrhizobium sp.]
MKAPMSPRPGSLMPRLPDAAAAVMSLMPYQFGLRMIFSENRYPLFGIMGYRQPRAARTRKIPT